MIAELTILTFDDADMIHRAFSGVKPAGHLKGTYRGPYT
jgi:hypothetical protein